MTLHNLNMIDIANVFSVPLIDLGDNDARFSGILSPAPELERSRVGITEQFLEDAESYHQRFSNTDYFKSLIAGALDDAPLGTRTPLILDLGSGSGNSVWPCLEIFPAGQVVATDLSPNLLAILRDHASTLGNDRQRLNVVCMDATQDYFVPDSFDFVVGAAILHHLIEPDAALASICRALKPGGQALFFEPFENGNAILTLAYQDIISQAESKSIREDVLAFLNGMVEDFRLRMAIHPGEPHFEELDDKWIFTRHWFERVAQSCGFRKLSIQPLHDLDQPFTNQTRANLNMGLGLPPEVLPDWAWETLSRFDNAFSRDLRADLMIEGRVILHK